jgi:hypothetical protein
VGKRLLDDKRAFAQCVQLLHISDAAMLTAGLGALASPKPPRRGRAAPATRR